MLNKRPKNSDIDNALRNYLVITIRMQADAVSSAHRLPVRRHTRGDMINTNIEINSTATHNSKICLAKLDSNGDEVYTTTGAE